MAIIKVLRLTTTVFITSVIIFIFPSSWYGGIDCLAGCAMGKGFPFQYQVRHVGGIVDFSPSPIEFYPGKLILNLAIWLGTSLVLSTIIGKSLGKSPAWKWVEISAILLLIFTFIDIYASKKDWGVQCFWKLGETRNECFSGFAIRKHRPWSCSLAGPNRDNCYSQIAKDLADWNICSKIRNSNALGLCQASVAAGKKDPSLCPRITNAGNRDSCYSFIAGGTQNASLCGQMQPGNARDYCYENVVRQTLDVSACSSINDPNIRSLCAEHKQ